jgi:hypothetical protein
MFWGNPAGWGFTIFLIVKTIDGDYFVWLFAAILFLFCFLITFLIYIQVAFLTAWEPRSRIVRVIAAIWVCILLFCFPFGRGKDKGK